MIVNLSRGDKMKNVEIELITKEGSSYSANYLYRTGNYVFIHLKLKFNDENDAIKFTRDVKRDIKEICRTLLNELD